VRQKSNYVAPAGPAQANPFATAEPSSAGDQRIPMAVCAGAAMASFLIYLRTVAPSISTGDSGELITAAWALGIAHPPGYPLFTMLGHLFSFLPLGSPALRVNLMSSVFAAATVGLVVWTSYRLLARSRNGQAQPAAWNALIAAAIGGGTLAVSTAFWAYAVVAEVFALNTFLAAVIMSLLLEWEHRPERLPLLYGFGLASGLAASNHHTIVLLAPACLVLIVAGARKLMNGEASIRLQARDLLRPAIVVLALIGLGLIPYLYLPLAALADPPLNWGDPRTLDAFFRHVTRADYGTFRLTVSDHQPAGSPIAHVGLLLRSLYEGFTPPGFVIGFAGLAWLVLRGGAAGLATALAFIMTGPAFVAYASPYVDNPILYGVIERFYILPSLFFAVALAAGIHLVLTRLIALSWPAMRGRLAGAIAVVLVALPASALLMHFARADQKSDRSEFRGRSARPARARRPPARSGRCGHDGRRLSPDRRGHAPRHHRAEHREAETCELRATDAPPAREPDHPVRGLCAGPGPDGKARGEQLGFATGLPQRVAEGPSVRRAFRLRARRSRERDPAERVGA
jgi:hypothetical protein